MPNDTYMVRVEPKSRNKCLKSFLEPVRLGSHQLPALHGGPFRAIEDKDWSDGEAEQAAKAGEQVSEFWVLTGFPMTGCVKHSLCLVEPNAVWDQLPQVQGNH